MASSKNSWKNPALYKTRLCDFWMVGKECKYGNRCWYSHGPQELRSVPHLEHDPVAKTVALSEVVDLLPPSKDRAYAMDHAQTMMDDANTEVFQRFTVPILNALAFQLQTMAKSGTGMPSTAEVNNVIKQQSSVEDLIPLLMQPANILGSGVKPSMSPQRDNYHRQQVYVPPMARPQHYDQSSKSSYYSEPSLYRSPKAKIELKKEDSLSSLLSNTATSTISDSSNSRILSHSFGHDGEEDADEQTVFAPIHDRLNSFCDSFFV